MADLCHLLHDMIIEAIGSGRSMRKRVRGDQSAEMRPSHDASSLQIRDTGAEEILRILSEKLDAVPQNTCDLIKKTWLKSEKELEEKNIESNKLKLELDDLKKRLQMEQESSKEKMKESDMLKSDLDDLKKSLQEQKKSSREKILAQEAMLRQVREEKNKLREMILNGPARQKISDEVIKQRFASLRQQIQAVAHNSAWEVDRPFRYSYQTNQYEMKFQQNYNLLSPSDRIYFIRATIYEIISYHILERDVFGLSSASNNSPSFQHFGEDNIEVQLEESLGTFEGHLKAKKVPNNLISDWRLTTFKCIETFNTEPNDPECTADIIWQLFSPLLKSRDGHSKLMLDIRQLCQDAYSLRLLTRQSEDRYHFRAPDSGVSFDPDKGFVQPCRVLGGGEISNIVAFTICGALQKETGPGAEDFNCLEPAHVVLQPKKNEQPPNNRPGSSL